MASERFYMIGLRSPSLRVGQMHRYFTMTDPHAKARYMSFSTEDVARQCQTYIASFRATTGSWPTIDMTQQNRFIKKQPPSKRRSKREIEESLLWIYEYDRDEIDWHALRGGVSFVWVHNFSIEPHPSIDELSQISFRAQEIDGRADPVVYLANLEKIYLEGSS